MQTYYVDAFVDYREIEMERGGTKMHKTLVSDQIRIKFPPKDERHSSHRIARAITISGTVKSYRYWNSYDKVIKYPPQINSITKIYLVRVDRK